MLIANTISLIDEKKKFNKIQETLLLNTRDTIQFKYLGKNDSFTLMESTPHKIADLFETVKLKGFRLKEVTNLLTFLITMIKYFSKFLM